MWGGKEFNKNCIKFTNKEPSSQNCIKVWNQLKLAWIKQKEENYRTECTQIIIPILCCNILLVKECFKDPCFLLRFHTNESALFKGKFRSNQNKILCADITNQFGKLLSTLNMIMAQHINTVSNWQFYWGPSTIYFFILTLHYSSTYFWTNSTLWPTLLNCH